MKKRALITILFYTLFFSRFVYAESFPPLFPITFEEILERTLSLVPAITTLVFAAVFFWGGYTWMTAADSDERVSKARSIMLSAVIGLIAIFLARPLLEFFQVFFNVQDPVGGG